MKMLLEATARPHLPQIQQHASCWLQCSESRRLCTQHHFETPQGLFLHAGAEHGDANITHNYEY